MSDKKGRAYSYIRFSTPEQAKGDSLRRQTEMAEAYCRRRGWILDTSLSLRDLGVSAFRGDNALLGNLGTFLEAVKRGTVPAGSALIVESVDRISRQGIDEGYDICKGILKAGVHIVTLSPERDFGPEAVKSLSKGALELQLILERAAEESERKSERVGAAWAAKRKRARENGERVTRWLPAWVEDRGGKLHLIPARAAAVKRIFALAAAGYGHKRLVARLTQEGVPSFGQSDHWTTSYINVILADRRALGEYQPRTRDGKADGKPIPKYFPAVVTKNVWLAARAGAAERAHKRGRVGEHINVFAGLLKSARDGESYFATQRNDEGGRRHVLINFAATEGRAPCFAFPLETFERAFLSLLAEVHPRDVLGKNDAPDETQTLAGALVGVEASIAMIVKEMDERGESPTLFNRLRVKEEEQRSLAAQLAEARQKAAHPLSESWGECQSLLSSLDKATDQQDARLRLRSVLRRVLEEVWLLVVPKGRDRLLAVQAWFTNGNRCRSYLIIHRSPRGNRYGRTEGSWWARSLASVAAPGDLDLRKRSDARKLEAALSAANLAELQ